MYIIKRRINKQNKKKKKTQMTRLKKFMKIILVKEEEEIKLRRKMIEFFVNCNI